jgi:Large ribosomal RNA subunit accumulation protein YceD
VVSTTPAPEFSRPLSLAEIGDGAMDKAIDASPEECAALAQRFDLIELTRLTAQFSVRREGAVVFALGRLQAAAAQSCVVTRKAVPVTVEEDFSIRFIEDGPSAPDAEIELSADDCDTMFYDGRVVDLGEAAAQTLALALDPFPRSIDAETVLKAAGVKGEGEAGPFGALAALKDRLKGG